MSFSFFVSLLLCLMVCFCYICSCTVNVEQGKKSKPKKKTVKRVLKPIDRRKGKKPGPTRAEAGISVQDNVRLSQNVVQLPAGNAGEGEAAGLCCVVGFVVFWN